MKVVIIADDLTGANDTGVQFARSGMKTSVLIEIDENEIVDADVVILDTDSRSLSGEEAYEKVKTASEYVKFCGFDVIYKKVDSTMRGNIGMELNAVYDAFQPDFIVFAPAYPQNNRLVKDGYLYMDGRLLHETEFANDPKTPIMDSFIPYMLEKQSVRKVGLITLHDLSLGMGHLQEKLKQFYADNIHYLVFDSETEQDMEQIVCLFKDHDYNIIWSGSAGLANYLTTKISRRPISISKSDQPVLIVIGSVNQKTRKQMDLILSEPHVKGVKLQSHKVVSNKADLEEELTRIYREAAEWIDKKQHIVLYSSGNPEEIELAQSVGSQNGINPTNVSDMISKALGQVASRLLHDYKLNRLILTGGDTAKQVFSSLHVNRFELIDEVEIGVPIGILAGGENIYGITKAGGFGSDSVLIHSLKILQGEDTICAQS